MIKKDGYLKEFAVDSDGSKYHTHPDSGDAFDQKIPDIEGLKELSLRVAQKLFYTRLVEFDICYDQDANWRVIEVNLFSGSLLFPQFSGVPFFEEFTDEVRDYCLLNHWVLK